MPAHCQEFVRVLGEAYGVAFDPLEHPSRQDDLVALYLGHRQKLDHRPARAERTVRVAEGE
jgi:hypothetical protein